jgi:hypothetical protein
MDNPTEILTQLVEQARKGNAGLVVISVGTAQRIIKDLAVQAAVDKLVFDATKSDPILEISTEDLIARIRKHIFEVGHPTLPNGIWALMLEATRQLAKTLPKRKKSG